MNNVDPSGCSWESFWNNVGSWIKNTFGSFVDISTKIINYCKDYFFFGYEKGINYIDTFGDNSKPISIFATNASDWWKFWEYQIGFQINIGSFSHSFSVGFGEFNTSFGWKETSIDFQIGINKIGIGRTTISGGLAKYEQYYIRTIPTALALAVIIFAPELIPATLPVVGKALGFC